MKKRYGDYSPSPLRSKRKREEFKELSPVEWRKYRMLERVKERYREKSIVADRDPKIIKKFLSENQINIVGKNAPNPVFEFCETPFDSDIFRVIKDNDWQKPTSIQSIAWPLLLAGCDVVGIARTGSGKTAAFLLPAIQHILLQPKMVKGDGPICLILVPTRELCIQVNEVCTEFCEPFRIKSLAIYGGTRRKTQGDEVRRLPEIIVATPGRLIDFLKSKDTNLRRCTYLVFDEADRMLDMGFEPAIRNIMTQIRFKRQTVMFSATWPRAVEKLAKSYMINPYQIKIGSVDLYANKNIQQKLEFVSDESSKFCKLKEILKLHSKEKGIVFVETKKRCDQLSRSLLDRHYHVAAMHGDKVQTEREDLLRKIKNGRIDILIATDVASRGLDIEGISFVINYDYPAQTEDYVHRIGRTARSENKGSAYTFLSNLSQRKAKELLQVMEDSEQDVPKALYQLAGLGRRRSLSSGSEEKNKQKSRSRSKSSNSSLGVVRRRKRSSTGSSSNRSEKSKNSSKESIKLNENGHDHKSIDRSDLSISSRILDSERVKSKSRSKSPTPKIKDNRRATSVQKTSDPLALKKTSERPRSASRSKSPVMNERRGRRPKSKSPIKKDRGKSRSDSIAIQSIIKERRARSTSRHKSPVGKDLPRASVKACERNSSKSKDQSRTDRKSIIKSKKVRRSRSQSRKHRSLSPKKDEANGRKRKRSKSNDVEDKNQKKKSKKSKKHKKKKSKKAKKPKRSHSAHSD